MHYKKSYSIELEKILAKTAKNKKLLKEFLKDLLTPTEYKDLAVRWQIIKQLKKGTTQRRISKSLGVSVATVTRGSRELLDKKGGFNQVWQKSLKKSKKRSPTKKRR